MAIPRQQFVALQSKYLFHLVSLSSNPHLARNGKELRDRHHVLQLSERNATLCDITVTFITAITQQIITLTLSEVQP